MATDELGANASAFHQAHNGRRRRNTVRATFVPAFNARARIPKEKRLCLLLKCVLVGCSGAGPKCALCLRQDVLSTFAHLPIGKTAKTITTPTPPPTSAVFRGDHKQTGPPSPQPPSYQREKSGINHTSRTQTTTPPVIKKRWWNHKTRIA